MRQSPALSLTARPGDGSIRGRRIAILVAPGVDGDSVADGAEGPDRGGGGRPAGRRLGSAPSRPPTATTVEPDATFETMPSVLFDAVVVPDGAKARHGARGARAGARVPPGPVPSLQADPPAGGRRAGSRRRRACPPTIGPTGRSCATSGRSSAPSASTATGTAPRIRRACDEGSRSGRSAISARSRGSKRDEPVAAGGLGSRRRRLPDEHGRAGQARPRPAGESLPSRSTHGQDRRGVLESDSTTS